MGQATPIFAAGARQAVLPASVTLAFQRMRQTWRLLMLVGLGMMTAVMVVCAVPLYAQIAMTAGLRTALTSSDQSTDIVVRGSAYSLPRTTIETVTSSLNQEFQRKLGPYLLPAQFSFQTSPLNIMAPGASSKLTVTDDAMTMTGEDPARAASHVHLTRGQMPGSSVQDNTIEVALRAEFAANLGWGPGTIIPLRVSFGTSNTALVPSIFRLKVVGIFTLLKNNDPFWHGENFLGYSAPNDVNFVGGALASNEALEALFSQNLPGRLPVSSPSTLVWYYSLDAARIQISQVDPILDAIQSVQVDNSNNALLNNPTALNHVQTYLPSTTLNFYHDRLPIVQFPVTSLTFLVLALALFFVTLMTGILVERQAGALALLRSRGASSGQIFWSLVTQAVVLGLVALTVGPLLSIVAARLLAEHVLPTGDQGALNIVSGNPLSVVLGVSFYALITACAMVLTMVLAIWSTASRDVLALRRESARSSHRPFWQRLNLDMIAVAIALLLAGFSIYLNNSSVLDARLRLLYLSPLTLLEALCILLAAMLLLLRGFPWVLRGGAWLTTRLRGAASLIALAQMSRAPRQSIRMTLLLALATAFTIFTLVFNASQTRRIQDVADYQAMADFSGAIPVAVIPPQQLASSTRSYKALPGVLSASLGYVKPATTGGSQLNLPIDFKAVDASTFTQTVRWSTFYSDQTLPVLMSQLVAQRSLATGKATVPAVVDDATWDELHLTLGGQFSLNFSLVSNQDLVIFKAIARVHYIPTASNSSIPGVLADYQSFVAAYTHNFTTSSGLTVPANYVWLRTSDNPTQLSLLRHQLNMGDLYLSPLNDRRQMVQELVSEPLYLTLFGILLLGTTTALLLALLGNLVASWLNASSRLANFAALRALGASPGQIAGTLAWEQVIIYTTAMLLGFLFGWLLSVLVLPSLIFTSILPSQISGNIDSQTFYAAQSTPPIQIVVPSALWLALGVLIVLCVVALGMMVRIVSRPSIAQVLRLNED